MDGRQPYQIVFARLAEFLGPHTARVALKNFAERTASRAPEELSRSDVPELLAALRPMLRTLIGRERAERLLGELARELE
ncbi:MAG TPA: hypothetical protein VFG59_10525 [Anaeromyxobacter sp.]|nr:hypothetical protein [Anaeromyxobacter sp.]